MLVDACPACRSIQLKHYPVSRGSQRRNFRCRACGLVGWADRDELVMPDSVGLDQITVEDREAWVASKRGHVVEVAEHEVLERLATMVGRPEERSIYDIGAGCGQFLSLAADRGFGVRGNDLIEANVLLAEKRYDIELDLGDLSRLDVPPHDIVTMWCVLAHVDNPAALLQSSFDLLRPGGILFLQTPRRTSIDSAAVALSASTRGRLSRLVDRRIAPHHWHLHTARSMTAALEDIGFVDVEVIPKARYSLQTASYLESLGLPGSAAAAVGRTADRLIDRGWAPRIVLEAFARKPGTPAPTAAQAAETAETAQPAGNVVDLEPSAQQAG